MINRRQLIALVVILCAAIGFRLVWVLWVNPKPQLGGGDAEFYLREARLWVKTGEFSAIRMQAVGPIYVSFLAIFYWFLHKSAVVQSVRIVQSLLDVVTCLAVFDIGRRLFNVRVGLLAAALMALDLRFVLQAADIYTETLYIFFLISGIWAFVVLKAQRALAWLLYSATAIFFLLASFTRAITAPLPVLLFGSLIFPRPTRTQLIVASILTLVGTLAVIGYGSYMYQVNGTFVFISDGLTSNFWMGSRGNGDWPGNEKFQEDLNILKAEHGGRSAYLEDAFKTISADPAGYLKLLAAKFVRAYAQPHGTVAIGGEGLKELAVEVLAGRAGVGEVLAQATLWPKIYIYLFHFFGLIGGAIGIWLTRKRWVDMLPLTLPIFYFSIAYTLLTVIPRYLFPLAPFFILLASYTVIAAWEYWKGRKQKPTKTMVLAST